MITLNISYYIYILQIRQIKIKNPKLEIGPKIDLYAISYNFLVFVCNLLLIPSWSAPARQRNRARAAKTPGPSEAAAAGAIYGATILAKIRILWGKPRILIANSI